MVFDETQFPFTTKSPPSQPDDTHYVILPPVIPFPSSDLSHYPVDIPISIHIDSIPTTVGPISLMNLQPSQFHLLLLNLLLLIQSLIPI